MYDLSTSKETQITTNESWNDGPSIYGNRIVWQSNSIGNWSNGDIYLYDLYTSKKTRITNDSSNQQDPAIYEDRIVWADWRNDKGNGSNGDIYLYDFSTSKEIQITTNESGQGTPAIYKDRVVWSDMRNGNSDIYMYNITTSEETQITNNEADQYSPETYGDIIVWTDWRNGNSDIYMYDITTSEETQITGNESNQYSPAVYGDRIVWEDERNGILDEFGRIGNYDIYMYNISTSTETQITTNTADQVEPFIYGNRIVWIDKRSQYTGTHRNSDIYIFTISGEETELNKPTSDFSTNVTEGYASLSVQFTDLSENATGRNWDFEDDGKVDSTDKNPVHMYTVPGRDTVKLIAFNANGAASKIATITVLQQVLPVANFTSNVTSGTEPLSVSFIDSSTGTPTKWNWGFGDGTNSTQQNPEHTYPATGNYTVLLTATNAAGNNTATKSDYIKVIAAVQKPIANFSSNVTEGYAPFSVQFTDSSVLNGLQSSIPPAPQVITPEDSGKSISLNNGETFTLKLKENPGFTGYSWELNMSMGLIILSEEYENQNPPDMYDGPLTRLVVIKAVSEGSQQVKGIYKRSWENTTGTENNFTLNVTSIPSNTISWLWDFGDGTNSTQQNPMHTYSSTGNYTVILTVANIAGQNTKTGEITVKTALQKPTAAFSVSPTSGTAPMKVKFTDMSTGSPTSWKWSFGDGTYSTAKNPKHTYSKAGKYTISLIAKNAAGSDKVVTQSGYINVVNPLNSIAAYLAFLPSKKAPSNVQFTENFAGLHRERN